MLPVQREVSDAPTEPFFTALLERDASGRTWLPALLAAAPGGPGRLGELAAAPGWLVTPLAVRAATGRLACFEFPTMPSRPLLRWYVDHPEALTWVDEPDLSPEAVRLRRALVADEPPGTRARAQDRARDLVATRSPLTRDWWRLEGLSILDCVLITDRLVVTVVGTRTGPLAPATPWYPPRSRLVRDVEAARQIANGRRWATLLLSDAPIADTDEADVSAALPVAAPHLDDLARDAMGAAYLGGLSWEAARAAVGLPTPA